MAPIITLSPIPNHCSSWSRGSSPAKRPHVSTAQFAYLKLVSLRGSHLPKSPPDASLNLAQAVEFVWNQALLEGWLPNIPLKCRILALVHSSTRCFNMPQFVALACCFSFQKQNSRRKRSRVGTIRKASPVLERNCRRSLARERPQETGPIGRRAGEGPR